MCGIVGVSSPELSSTDQAALASGMLQNLRHRGPDGQRVWSAPNGTVTLGHARLSVIDLESGWQPMIDSATGCAVSYNGELYNYRELRATLERDGVRFETQSDTEVLLQSYLRWGREALARFNGMFAFLIHDPRDDSLFLARDPMGIKPLYYTIEGQTLLAASELRTVALAMKRDPRLDPAGFAHYSAMGYVLAPKTILQDVLQLPHGHFAIWKNGTLRSQRYLDLASAANARTGHRLSTQEAAEELDSLLEKAVRRQLVSDVPVGTFLSGGVDSSLVTFLSRSAAPGKLQAFTIGFEEKDYSEVAQARQTAKEIGIHQSVHVTRPTDLLEQWRYIAWQADAPIFDSSFFPTKMLCGFARKQVTVALSGDGGDELFLGYETYRADRLAQTLRRLGAPATSALSWMGNQIRPRFGKVTLSYKLKAFARSASRSAAQAHCGWRELADGGTYDAILSSDQKEAFENHHPRLSFEAIYKRVAAADELTRMSYLDCETWLAHDILVKADRASMAHGLEVRVPLLDWGIACFALGLPDRTKFDLKRPKKLLAEALARRLPSYPKNLPKRGFNAPMSEWLGGPLFSEVKKALSKPTDALAMVVRPDSLLVLAEEHRAKRSDHGHILWALMALNEWLSELQSRRSGRLR